MVSRTASAIRISAALSRVSRLSPPIRCPGGSVTLVPRRELMFSRYPASTETMPRLTVGTYSSPPVRRASRARPTRPGQGTSRKYSADPRFGRVRVGVERAQRFSLSQGGRMSTMAIGLERDQLRLVGSRPGTAGKGPRMGAAGRICEASRCRTVLSRYNYSELCWQHEPRHEYLSAVR